MKNSENSEKWVDVAEALQILQVKRDTLYAYVSRSYVRSKPMGGTSRASLYALSDLEKMATKRRRPRKRAEIAKNTIKWGEPILETRISTVIDDQLIFGDKKAAELANSYTLEQVSAHHWSAGPAPNFVVDPYVIKAAHGVTPETRAFAHLAALATESPSILGRSREELSDESHKLLSGFTDSVLGRPLSGAIHQRLARHWKLLPDDADIIRRALVLISDHELNASTFAVRVTASTGASLPAAALAGLSALSGPLHGTASVTATVYLRSALQAQNIADYVKLHPEIPGMGHPFYRTGDMRAKNLLKVLKPSQDVKDALAIFEEISGKAPNIDMAHAVLAHQLSLPNNAGFMIFAIGRMSGWLAHAIEQSESGELIRPRAIYQGRA